MRHGERPIADRGLMLTLVDPHGDPLPRSNPIRVVGNGRLEVAVTVYICHRRDGRRRNAFGIEVITQSGGRLEGGIISEIEGRPEIPNKTTEVSSMIHWINSNTSKVFLSMHRGESPLQQRP